MLPPRLIALEDLKPNPIKTRPVEVDKNLLASIAAHGLLQPLAVRGSDKSGWIIIAGHHRVAAIKKLKPEVRREWFGKECKVPCQVLQPDVSDSELAIAENQFRRGLSAMQECDAFTEALKADGVTVNTVAANLGLPPGYVKQRLALSRLIDPIKGLVEDGKLDIDAASVLTTASAREQKQLLPQLKRGASDHNIRAWLKGSGATTDAALPGVKEAYLKAGGKIIEDLFGNEDRVEDAVLFNQLQGDEAKRLVAEADKVYAHADLIEVEPGDYSWRSGLGYLNASVKDKKRLCYFLVHRDGRYEILDAQYLEKYDPKAKAPGRSKIQDTVDKALAKGDPLPATKALYRRMNVFGAAAVRAAMVEQTATRTAMALLICGRIGGHMPEFAQVFGTPSDTHAIDGLCTDKELSSKNSARINEYVAQHKVNREQAPDDQLDGPEVFNALMAMSEADFNKLFVSVVADQIASPDGEGPMQGDTVYAEIAKRLSVTTVGYRPDEWFFSQLKVSRLKEISETEGLGKTEKRGELIKGLAEKFAGMSDEEAQRDWPELVFAVPVEKTAMKAKAA